MITGSNRRAALGCLRFRKQSLQNLPAEIAGIAVRFIELRNQILCTAIVALDNPVSLRNAVPLIIPHADHTSAGFLMETRLNCRQSQRCCCPNGMNCCLPLIRLRSFEMPLRFHKRIFLLCRPLWNKCFPCVLQQSQVYCCPVFVSDRSAL